MIERIYVHNYRCFENFTLDLAGKGSALIIGKNGSGKSTLRHVLGVLQSLCRNTSRIKDIIQPSDFTNQRTAIPIRFELRVSLGGRRFDYFLTFEWSERYGDVRVSEEHLMGDRGSVFNRVGSSVTLQNGGQVGIDIPGPLIPMLNIRDGDGSIQQLRSFFSSMVLLSPIPVTMTGYAEEESNELREDGSNVAAWVSALLLRSPAGYNRMQEYLVAVLPDFTSFELVPRGERGKNLAIRFESKGNMGSTSLSLDFRQLSDGEKCFFLSAAILAFNRPDKPLFCFWDEPDNHLSLPEVGQFVTELRRITNQHGQFIATSHHPETIRRFSDENTFVFTRNSHLEPTVVRPLNDITYGKDLVRALVRGEVI